MKTAVVVAVCLWGALSLGVRAQGLTWSDVENAAVSWTGTLPCDNWDCDCAFSRPRGCCCVAKRYNLLEDTLNNRLKTLQESLAMLQGGMAKLIDGVQVVFSAVHDLTGISRCFGPFTNPTPIPYREILLNLGHGYNPALGAFTAPRDGLYFFSFSVASNVGLAGNKMYNWVSLMRNMTAMASVWEDNREDSEDSGSQTVLLPMRVGDQVYVELQSGRMLCDAGKLNTFSGHLVYPY
ncbi:cerebellin 18 [Amia ocellicauda]|uniref:cerebellin 18 n=1 Tax=Amia ocellicauda TaxID=2972642 RepID=UPI003464A934